MNVKTAIHFWNDESGVSATEYALTLAIIGGCVALTAVGLGYAIGHAMNTMTECIDRRDGACHPETAGAEPTPAAAAAVPAAAPIPTPAAGPIPAADPTPPSGIPGKGKPPKPGKGCPTRAHCRR